MTRKRWKSKIKKACEEAGTYQPFFDQVIDTLAGILELRDSAAEQFEALGGETVVEYTNKAGATNMSKNPALMVLMDCNAQALNYWNSMGLTAKSYKAMTGSLNIKMESESLEKALADLGV